MNKKKRIILSCDEANHVCDKSQYNEASLWEKIRLSLHLFYCKFCRKYSKNNAKLTKLVNDPKVDCLANDEKDRIKAKFIEEIAKDQ